MNNLKIYINTKKSLNLFGAFINKVALVQKKAYDSHKIYVKKKILYEKELLMLIHDRKH